MREVTHTEKKITEGEIVSRQCEKVKCFLVFSWINLLLEKPAYARSFWCEVVFVPRPPLTEP